MKPQRLLLGWVLGTLAATAAAQADPLLRWRGGALTGLGLRPAQLELRIDQVQPNPVDRVLGRAGSPGLDLRWSRAGGEPADLGLYGRLGTFDATPLPSFGAAGGGLTYGVGLRWDFSPRASAILGWDSYDMRTAAGERGLRATSLGLQLRY